MSWGHSLAACGDTSSAHMVCHAKEGNLVCGSLYVLTGAAPWLDKQAGKQPHKLFCGQCCCSADRHKWVTLKAASCSNTAVPGHAHLPSEALNDLLLLLG